MWKFIVVTFGVLGLMFYELSGGADFVPEERPRETVAEATPEPEITAEEILAMVNGDTAEVDIPSSDNGNVSLASTSEIELDGVSARLAGPVIGGTATSLSDVSFASLSVSPDGSPLSSVEAQLDKIVEDVAFDLRAVDASALNVRSGPSTSDSVVGRLEQFEIVSVLEETADGWARIRIEGDGIEGWVAARFLTE